MPNGNGSPKGKRKARSNLREILFSLTPGREYFVVQCIQCILCFQKMALFYHKLVERVVNIAFSAPQKQAKLLITFRESRFLQTSKNAQKSVSNIQQV